MEDVTSPPFRYVCKKYGADILYTEFISSEALIRDAEKSKKKLDIYDFERPVAIQIFGNNIESMVRAAQIAEEANPDFIDINCGCPAKKIAGKGAGSGLLKDVPFMVDMVNSIVKAVKLPVTVKTRIGWDSDNINIHEVAEKLQDTGIAALAIHGRTKKQMYKGFADWDTIGEVKNNPKIHIPIIGNGDIKSAEDAKMRLDQTGVDAIMIGRATIGRPWIFNEIKSYLQTGELIGPPSVKERVELTKVHLQKSLEWKGEVRGLFEMRQHFSNYFKGLRDFKSTRLRLVTSTDLNEIDNILNEVAEKWGSDTNFDKPDLNCKSIEF